MRGLGTIINTLAVLAGGLIGMCFRTGMPKKMQDTLMQACGVASMFIGVAGVLSKMLVVEDGKFATQGTLMLILSLVVGAVIGELLDIEQKVEVLGEKIKAAAKVKNDNHFVEGFVNVSLIICVGAMAIVGAIQDGISGDYSMLAAKAVLDMIIVIVFASTYGLGAVFSALPIFIYQGTITLFAMAFGSFASEAVINDLSFVGSALIFCVGVNICFGKKINVGNLLPALVIAIAPELLTGALGIHMM